MEHAASFITVSTRALQLASFVVCCASPIAIKVAAVEDVAKQCALTKPNTYNENATFCVRSKETLPSLMDLTK